MTDIRLFLTDVDGTLTDGGMYYTSTGDTMKSSTPATAWVYSSCSAQE